MNHARHRLMLLLLAAFLGAGPALAAAAEPESYTLNIYYEGGGKTVQVQDLIDLIHTLAANADVKWDLAAGIMVIENGSQKIQVLASVPTVIVNGQEKTVSRKVLVRQDGVYIPIDTVKLVFDAMGVNFDIKDETPAGEPAPTPAPTGNTPAVPLPGVPLAQPTPPPVPRPPVPVATPDAPLPTPAAAVGVTSATQGPEVAMAVPAVPIPKVLPSFKAAPADAGGAVTADLPPLQPPASQAAKITGLTWGQLADLTHRTPPRRLTIVYDGPFRSAAETLAEQWRRTAGLEVNLVPVNNLRRDSDGLVSRVAATQPELLIDLVNSPLEDKDLDGETFAVWTVHHALWPKDRAPAGRTPAATSLYLRHEFQSMALGSLLRFELGRQFPSRTITYELSPSYLLRRVDAPAAVVLIPGAGDAESGKRLVSAVSEAVGAYLRGMSRFSAGR